MLALSQRRRDEEALGAFALVPAVIKKEVMEANLCDSDLALGSRGANQVEDGRCRHVRDVDRGSCQAGDRERSGDRLLLDLGWTRPGEVARRPPAAGPALGDQPPEAAA